MSKMEEYAIVKTQIAALEKQASSLSVEVLEELRSQGLTKAENALGKFTVTPLKSWKYPSFITEAEDKLKADKAKAQSTGDATYEEKPSLRFTPINL